MKRPVMNALDLTLTERELLKASPDAAAWEARCESVEERLQELEFSIGDLVDQALGTGPGGERWPPGIFAREVLDRLSHKLQTHASVSEVEFALQWVLGSPESHFNKRRRP